MATSSTPEPDTREPGEVRRDELWVTVREAALRCGLAERTIWTRISQGLIPVHRFGRRATRIRKDDLDAFIERHRGRPGA